jgi:hypothetical protein
MVPEHLARTDGEPFIGLYSVEEETLTIRDDYYFALGDPGEALDSVWHGISDANTFVTVHELFHAIQYTYPGFRSAAFDRVPFKWITEGTANLVMRVYADKFEQELGARLPARHFDTPLHDPRESSENYGTWIFWRFVGEEIGSVDGVQYLASILSADLHEDNGLAGVDSALSEYGGLYELLPQFFTELPPGLDGFGSPEVFRVQLEANETEITRPSIYYNVREVAGRQIDVFVEGSTDDPVDVEIRLLETDADLHLLVDRERYDQSPGARRNVFRK